jgi:hypothetical protein
MPMNKRGQRVNTHKTRRDDISDAWDKSTKKKKTIASNKGGAAIGGGA